MTDTKRDLWSWAELLISVVSGIAIPLLLGYFGWQYRLDQKEARNTDRIRNATELLASENWRERVMGVRFMWHYCAENQQYPDPLISSLIRTMRTDPNPHVYREAAHLFGTAHSSSPCHVRFDESSSDASTGSHAQTDDLSPSGTRAQLYIHVQKEGQTSRARRILRAVDSLAVDSLLLDAVSVEQLARGPSRTELRYFDPRQRDVATAIRRQADLPPSEVALRDFSTDYDTIPNHFELWLAP
jgi:hypothetical protein